MNDNLDISVLILFFNRPEHLRQVFEAVRQARPARLFLYQDGPRGEQDVPRVEACRKVVAEVDWPCEVHRNYQARNAGCDPSGYNAHRWAFSQTDRCIVLEDDVVPAPSFFPFCQEMLERYATDERVGMVSGFNHDGETTDIADDYFFTSNYAIWGWASWARVVNRWEGDYGFWHDEASRRQIEALVRDRRWRGEQLRIFGSHAHSGRAFHETVGHANLMLHSQLAIVPRVNMIRNVGAEVGGTHFDASVAMLPARYRRLFLMPALDLQWPLRHPRYIIDHTPYLRRVYLVNAWDNPWRKVQYSMEELWLNLRSGNLGAIWRAVRNRLVKTFGRNQYV